MKKKFLCLALATVIGFADLQAQTRDSSGKPIKSGNEWRMPDDVIKRSRQFSEGLQNSLALNDDVTNKIFQAYLANTKPVDEIKMMSTSEQDKMKRLQANHAQFDEKMKAVLSPAQFEKYKRLEMKPQEK